MKMNELALMAQDAVEDILGEDRWEWFLSLSEIEQVQWRYCHSDCDDFALTLSEITGWDIVALNSVHGPIHRLVQSPDGHLLDARGWTTIEMLADRYQTTGLTVVPGAPWLSSTICGDEDFQPIICAIRHLPEAPFSEASFREQVLKFAETIGVESF